MLRKSTALQLVVVALLSGCRARQLQQDQDAFRGRLLQMETDQIMDNLIRAHNGLPILHIDYGAITGTVTDNFSGSANGSYTDQGGLITRMFGAMAGGSKEQQLTVTGNPVRNDPNIYMAYLQFLKLPDSLVLTAKPPPPGMAHIVRCCHEGYYSVPAEYKGEFFELAMRVIGLRGQPLAAPQALEVTVKEATISSPKGIADKDVMENTAIKIEMTLEGSIKNDSGTFTVPIEGITYKFNLAISNKVGAGSDISSIVLSYRYGTGEAQYPLKPNELTRRLAGQTIRIYSSRNPPSPPTKDQLLVEIRDQLNQIRLDRLRIGR